MELTFTYIYVICRLAFLCTPIITLSTHYVQKVMHSVVSIYVIRRQLRLILYTKNYACIEKVSNKFTLVSGLVITVSGRNAFGRQGMADTFEEVVLNV